MNNAFDGKVRTWTRLRFCFENGYFESFSSNT